MLYNGVDTTRFAPRADRPELRRALGLPEAATIAVTVASFTPIKDHASLLSAAAPLLRAPDSDLHLVFVGDGGLRPALERQIGALGIRHRVVLAGQQDCVPQWLQAADLFVLPSRSEGMSNAIQEAMASALPVIARRAGGNPELVEHGLTGLLYDADDPAGAGPALWQLLRDRPLRERLGAAARARAETRFSLAAMLDAYAQLYRATAREA